jgi:putative flippase GtrA
MVGLVWALGMTEVAASCAGFVAGALVKYPLNYWMVFSSGEKHRVAVARFVVALAISFVANAAVLALLLRVLPVHYMVSQVLTTGIVLLLNYLLAKQWIFRAGGRPEIRGNAPPN